MTTSREWQSISHVSILQKSLKTISAPFNQRWLISKETKQTPQWYPYKIEYRAPCDDLATQSCFRQLGQNVRINPKFYQHKTGKNFRILQIERLAITKNFYQALSFKYA